MSRISPELEKKFSPKELFQIRKEFGAFDKDGDGFISSSELFQVLEKIGEPIDLAKVNEMIASVDKNRDGRISYEEFLHMIASIRSGEPLSLFASTVKKIAPKLVVQASTSGTTHSFTEEEKVAFVEHINQELADDAHLKSILPVDPAGMDIFKAVGDGLILAKLINVGVPGTVDERVLNVRAKKSVFEVNENLNLVVESAKAIGCSVVNVGAGDIVEGKPHIILGLLWQIIRTGLFQEINLTTRPELVRLLKPGEELSDFLKLPPDAILIRWVNYHLERAGSSRRITNFSGDIKDAEVYTILLHQIAPECDTRALQRKDSLERAEIVLENADKIHCRKFVKPRDIVNGQPKLNLAFVANLFNTRPALDALEKAQLDLLNDLDDLDEEGSREERAFRNWMISLGIDVNNFFEDLRDGVKFLELFDKVTHPSVVDWTKVNREPKNKFKKVENCNYAVLLGKQLKFSMVNIGGSDIVDGNRKLMLGLVWQLMRFHTLQTLQGLKVGGKEVTEQDILNWANEKVGSKYARIASFSDPSIRNGRFLIHLAAAVEPRSVNFDVVASGDSDDDNQANAKYVIGCARKIGASVFLLWEDIVEVKKKMILVFVGSLMAVAQRHK